MKRKLKLTLLQKTLLAVSTIVVGSGVALGSMLFYASKSDEVLGSYSAVDKNLFKNDYSSIRDENGELKAKISIVDPLKQKAVGEMSEDGSQYWFNSDPEHKMTFNEFFNAYYDKYQESFIQEIKYGSFNFYNEYVLAVRPEKFLEFSKWFINEVAWGPDLLTLESFRIVPGVERNGNSITLGSHSTLHKESSEIKFFPDAFFGTAPIWSIAGGAGNARDALTEITFESPVSKYQADGFLKNLVQISILKNSESFTKADGLPLYRNEQLRSFKNVFFVGRLQGDKVKVLVDQQYLNDYQTYNSSLKTYERNFEEWIQGGAQGRAPQLPVPPRTQNARNLVLPADITADEFNDLIKTFGDEYKDYSYSDLVEYTISNARAGAATSDEIRSTYLALDLTNENNEFTLLMFDSTSSPAQYYAEQMLEKMVNSKFKNFLDFYDMDQYKGRKVYLYEDDSHKTYYSNPIQARDKEHNFDQSNLLELTVESFEVANKSLYVTLADAFNQKRVQIFEASETDKDSTLFRNFKYSLGYSGAVIPRTLNATPESLNEKDQEGNLLRGLDSRKFQIYTDAYDGLLDELAQKYPFLMKKQNGPHLEKTIDENGVYKYEIKEGDFVAFSIDDGIGIPIILANTIENYQGVSTDFLKYVGAHEYGHHYTLEKSQAIDEKDSAVLVGGINVRGGVSDSSYYSFKALENYIKARTTLNVRRVDALGNPNEKGTFTQFGYIKNDGTNSKWETYEDVWGSKDRNIISTIRNKNRRFIQTFEGLNQAAKNRDVRLGDLFLANSLDSESGTLNPFIEGVGKVIYNDGDQKVFKSVSLVEMLSQFKDGKGNSLEFTGTTPSDIAIKFYESTQNEQGQTIVTKFNVFNKDGTPVVNVPLNTPLSNEELQYLQDTTQAITRNIVSLYNLNNFDSGWNNSQTSVSGEISLAWRSLFDGVAPKSFFNSILYRNDDTAAELDPQYNGLPGNYREINGHISKTRKSNLYYAVSNEDTNLEVLNGFFRDQFNTLQSGSNPNFSGPSAAIFYSNKVLAFVNSNHTEATKYVFPIGIDRGASSNALGQSRFNQFFNQITRQTTQAGYQLSPAAILSQGFGYSTANGGVNDINLGNAGVYFISVDDQNNPITNYSNVNSISKVGYNLFSSSYLTLDRAGLYGAYSTDKVQLTTVNGRELPLFEFVEDLVEYGSIDYSKATAIEQDSKVVYNWDIDYVKTKINLDKLREGIQKEPDSEAKTAILASDQSLANEAMRRFISSPLVFTVKDFNVKDLAKNRAIFSKDYGMRFFNAQFNRSYVDSLKAVEAPLFNVDTFVNSLREVLENYYNKLAANQYPQGSANKAFENLSLNDLFVLLGNSLIMESDDNEYFLTKLNFAEFSDGTPTSDAIDYFNTKNEPLLNDKFTDYVYSMAETLTRDYVQTIYSPGTQDFGNLPSYLSNINESNTGLDYITDASALSIWNDRVNSRNGIANGTLFALQVTSNPSEYFAKRSEIQQKYAKLQADKVKELADFTAKSAEEQGITAIEYNTKLSNLRSQLNAVSFDRDKELSDLLKKYTYNLERPNVQNDTRIQSSYFGRFSANNNGYFKDRWEKETIGTHLYDPTTGEEIHDETIRLLDLNGEKITSRPRAFFLSQLYNYGVGDRTVSGIFRHKKIDALALYGYIKNEYANKIKKLKFTNIETGEVKYLDVNIEKTNNIFYLKKQGDSSSKVTLADEGYSTWISDYALMGKYRDALLFPGNSFTIDFVDENNNELKDENNKPLFTLGSGKTLSENGKDQDNAPVKISAKATNSKGEEIDKATITVDLQFNVIG